MDAECLGARRFAIMDSFRRHYWSDEPPSWAKDTYNGDTACTCGDCGAWMEVVRPGKVQCGACAWIAS